MHYADGVSCSTFPGYRVYHLGETSGSRVLRKTKTFLIFTIMGSWWVQEAMLNQDRDFATAQKTLLGHELLSFRLMRPTSLNLSIDTIVICRALRIAIYWKLSPVSVLHDSSSMIRSGYFQIGVGTNMGSGIVVPENQDAMRCSLLATIQGGRWRYMSWARPSIRLKICSAGAHTAPEVIVCVEIVEIAMRTDHNSPPTRSDNSDIHHCIAACNASDVVSFCLLACTAPKHPPTVRSLAETGSFLVRHPHIS